MTAAPATLPGPNGSRSRSQEVSPPTSGTRYMYSEVLATPSRELAQPQAVQAK